MSPWADLLTWPARAACDAWEYSLDACQRWVLFWDTLRRRGDNAMQYHRQGCPPLLHYEYETILDGRELPRPANYALLQIRPDPAVAPDARKRPFIIVDPRAGHGPGIGGFKEDSEVGFALRAGHPVYFISFFHRPVPGQTLADVAAAQARFIEEVARRHAEADKPAVIGNCQAGWAVAALAAVRPQIMGPLILNGAPLAYWSGVSGRDPMGYTGGLLGGKWTESLACDLGHGLFDGAWIVMNFENLNPANTLWTKYYNLYAKADTEAERFLEFERWWSAYSLMNAQEMDRIVSELFIGNKLARGQASAPDGTAIDLENIRSPVVVFASRGDNITPPQQALNWIQDVYGSEQALIDSNRVVIYLLHENIGHLGIFVSGRVARKEHAQLVGTLEIIDALPPGLYQMLIEPAAPVNGWPEAADGEYRVRFEMRTMRDLSALDGRRQEERGFAVVEAVSRMNDGMYQACLGPWIRLLSTEWSAELLRQAHPLRVQRRLLSTLNPLLALAGCCAPIVRHRRRPVRDGNMFWLCQQMLSDTVITALDSWRDTRDTCFEAIFRSIYGPSGWGAIFHPAPARTVASPRRAAMPAVENDGLRTGGPLAAILRIAAAGCLDTGVFDYRSVRILESLLGHSAFRDVTPTELKALFRQQAALLRRRPQQAIGALRDMLLDERMRRDAIDAVAELLKAVPEAAEMNGRLGRRVRRVLDMDRENQAPRPGGKKAAGSRGQSTLGGSMVRSSSFVRQFKL